MESLSELHTSDKEISAQVLFKGTVGTATAIQLQRHGSLKEHSTASPALLICIEGRVTYEDENEQTYDLEAGDFVRIPAQVKHWLYAPAKAQLVLLK